MKRWVKILIFVVVIGLVSAGYLISQIRAIDIEQLDTDLWVLRGAGGNTAVLRTSAGTIVVDTMTLPMQGKRIRQVAKSLTGSDTVLLINTHYHLDHTHGNPAFEPGTRVLSTARTLSHLEALDADFWSGDAAQLLPNETFADRQTLMIGGKTLELVHTGPAHTDGDLVVVFRDESVIHLGDLLFHGHYPNIDLEAGGSVQNWPLALRLALNLPFERVIPGHGATTDRSGVTQFQDFMRQLAGIGLAAAATGASLEETLATEQLTEDANYEPLRLLFIPLGLDRDFVLSRSWEEATGNFTRSNP